MAPAEAFEVVQWAIGTVAAALKATAGTRVDESVVVPAVNVVFAAVNSVPVEKPRDHPPAQVAMVVVTFAVAPITVERVGMFTEPRLVLADPVARVTIPGSIIQYTAPPPVKAASLIAS